MATPEILILIISIAILVFAIGIRHYSKKISLLIKKHPSESTGYGKSLTVGIVAGMVVLVLDRIVNITLTNLPSIDASSLWSFVLSSIGIIIIIVFVALFLILSILFLIYQGFPTKN